MEHKNKVKTVGGLRELPSDDRDILLGGLFGTFPIPDIDFVVSSPLVIKDQGGNDECTAYAGTAVSEDQENIELDPDFNFAATLEIMGGSEWGADLRSADKSFVVYGSIPKGNFTGNPKDLKTWSEQAKVEALKYKKASYMFIKTLGYNDLFDALRANLFHFKDEKRSILTGITWNTEWLNAPKGIIDTFGTPSFGHAFKIFGQKKINGKWYLIAQLSQGNNVGDNGLFYFGRDVINKGLTFGNIIFTDMSKEDAQYYQYYNIKILDNWLIHFWKILLFTLGFK